MANNNIPITPDFHRKYLHVIKMLERRGYTVEQAFLRDLETVVDANMTLDELREQFQSLEEIVLYFEWNLLIGEERETSLLKLVYLRLTEGAKEILESQIEEHIREVESSARLERLLLIAGAPLHRAAKRKVDLFNLADNPIKTQQLTEVFSLDEFAFDRLAHRWVPKYDQLGDRDLASVLRLIQVPPDVDNKLALFPVMMRSDPIARYFGIKPGKEKAVVRLRRQYPVPRVSYRVVTEDYEVD